MFDIKTKTELKRGNPSAFKEVFRLLYPRLKGYCKLFITNQNQVEDIIQESFITLWEKRESIKPNKSVESYVFVIVRNRCLNVLKKQKLEEGKIELDNLNAIELQYLYQLDFIEKEEKSMEEMLTASFQNAIEELPNRMKKVFTKCKIEGRKQKEVAKELGISLKMVEKHISKAKQQIRKKLLQQYPALIVLIALFIE
ncbi:MAG: RNA polymerase sigma-70 factor [Prolixibacteraceae bacterium]|jgi:RNA polymerase sigma-70 factor, ECF subfamily|nr:RNA polymerase sigma-70 factor [Prolixibacteraceae bacterium]MBT6004556.1 RNA polymerase sigma-70 factor [Prolixibacteraceae bacterium]MBT6763069.1 RNA polymerase sigma-70 factor [Prolixibacteraceae bacterium]MBT7000149.1 RNA polymerase sigma-70 factor [Prolixibacteraceae bacterium]MBT7395639.1 RNA polymerase sigma-70 factor [Prolixibacteraceae bacterium]